MLHRPRPTPARVPADKSDQDSQALMSAAGLLGAAVIVLLLAALL